MRLVLLVRGLTLPGAGAGIRFYLYPDISRLEDPEVLRGTVGLLLPPSPQAAQGGNCRAHALPPGGAGSVAQPWCASSTGPRGLLMVPAGHPGGV